MKFHQKHDKKPAESLFNETYPSWWCSRAYSDTQEFPGIKNLLRMNSRYKHSQLNKVFLIQVPFTRCTYTGRYNFIFNNFLWFRNPEWFNIIPHDTDKLHFTVLCCLLCCFFYLIYATLITSFVLIYFAFVLTVDCLFFFLR